MLTDVFKSIEDHSSQQHIIFVQSVEGIELEIHCCKGIDTTIAKAIANATASTIFIYIPNTINSMPLLAMNLPESTQKCHCILLLQAHDEGTHRFGQSLLDQRFVGHPEACERGKQEG